MSDNFENIVSNLDNPQPSNNIIEFGADHSSDDDDVVVTGESVDIRQIEPNFERYYNLRSKILNRALFLSRVMFNDNIPTRDNDESSWERIAERNSAMLAEAQAENCRLLRVINQLNEDNITYQRIINRQDQLLDRQQELLREARDLMPLMDNFDDATGMPSFLMEFLCPMDPEDNIQYANGELDDLEDLEDLEDLDDDQDDDQDNYQDDDIEELDDDGPMWTYQISKD